MMETFEEVASSAPLVLTCGGWGHSRSWAVFEGEDGAFRLRRQVGRTEDEATIGKSIVDLLFDELGQLQIRPFNTGIPVCDAGRYSVTYSTDGVGLSVSWDSPPASGLRPLARWFERARAILEGLLPERPVSMER